MDLIRYFSRHTYTLGCMIVSILFLPGCRHEINGAVPRGDIDDPTAGGLIEVPFSVISHDSPIQNIITLSSLRGISVEDGDFDKASYDTGLNENKIDKLDLFLAYGGNIVAWFSSKKSTLVIDEVSSTVKAKITKAQVDVLENKSVDIYLVANAKQEDFSGITTYSALKALVQDDSGSLSPNPVTPDADVKPQERFLMDGATLNYHLVWGTQPLHHVTPIIELRRAASKIRVRVDRVDVTDHQNGGNTKYQMIGEPYVKLLHYTEKGTVIASDVPYDVQPNEWRFATEYRRMPERIFSGKDVGSYPHYDGKFYASMPFYTYQNDWSKVQDKETYLLMKIRMRPLDSSGNPIKIDSQGNPTTDGSGIEDPGREYFYRLPINYRMDMDGVPTEKIGKLERNHLYDIRTTIEVLGSIDEDTPMDIKSYVAIQEWNKPDVIDGSLSAAHFLVVKEHNPLMPNISVRDIGYISSTPIDVMVTKAYYQYYDIRGEYHKVEFDLSNSWDNTTVTASANHLDGTITVKHNIPINFVPFYIELDVRQKSPGVLMDKILVTQYPPRFVTGQMSPGRKNGKERLDSESGTPVNADFRHHTSLGALARYSAIGSDVYEPQKNEVFSRVTTVVPLSGEIIGTAVSGGKTKSDERSNKMISPEFIISSQYGMSLPTEQRTNNGIPVGGVPNRTYFGYMYGPNSGRFYRFPEYYNNRYGYISSDYHYYYYYAQTGYYYVVDQIATSSTTNPQINAQYLWRDYTSAEDRCYNYFEGEYGADGVYTEHYLDTSGIWRTRNIYKTFKYKGRWRIPTLAEVDMINKLQKNPNSIVKGLMFGAYYWSALQDYAYAFAEDSRIYYGDSRIGSNVLVDGYGSIPNIYVRCVFDTFGLDDKGEYEIKK